jgi:putative membrane protein
LKRLLLRWLFTAVGLWALIGIINMVTPGSIKATSMVAPFVLIVVLGLVNAIIRPLLKLLTLPLSCLTFGIFGVVINLILFWFAFRVTPGFEITWTLKTFLSLYIGMIVISMIVNHILRKDEDK